MNLANTSAAVSHLSVKWFAIICQTPPNFWSFHRRATVNENISNFWLWQLAQWQLRILKTTYCWKMSVGFSRYSGCILRVSKRSKTACFALCVPNIIQISSFLTGMFKTLTNLDLGPPILCRSSSDEIHLSLVIIDDSLCSSPCHCLFEMVWGDLVADWLACWTQAQKGLGLNRSRDAGG